MEALKTQRLVIRQFRSSDLADFLGYQTLAAVRRYMPDEPLTADQAERWLASQAQLAEAEPNRYHSFAVEHRADGRVIGDVGFFRAAGPERTADLGFQFHPAYHGQGYAYEAAAALLRYGFRQWHLRRITAGCDARNTASFRLLERLGMRREAHFKQSRITRGVLHDEYRYGLLVDEWDVLMGGRG